MRQPKEPSTLTPKKLDGQLIKRAFDVCTPVFGGGVNPKEIDLITPIRVSSIIGQLRFWWRAIEGVRYETLDELRRAEGALWGTTSAPGLVTLWVEGQPISKDLEKPSSGYDYGTFPLRQGGKLTELSSSSKDAPHSTLYARISPKKGTQEVALEQRELVELVIDAWLHFGGVGGRTRRGFGAVMPTQGTHDIKGLLKRIQSRLPQAPVYHRLMPTLHGARVRLTERQDIQTAHTNLLKKLSAFRQKAGFARGIGTMNDPSIRKEDRRPGQSFWPEPDEIRRLTTYNPRHKPKNQAKGFPRAHFGMPIITHFKQDDPPSYPKDPAEVRLQPEGKERMASPLIIRPCSTTQGFRGLALYLNVPGMRALRLEFANSNIKGLSMKLTGDTSKLAPMNSAQPHDNDPVVAFLNYLKGEQLTLPTHAPASQQKDNT